MLVPFEWGKFFLDDVKKALVGKKSWPCSKLAEIHEAFTFLQPTEMELPNSQFNLLFNLPHLMLLEKMAHLCVSLFSLVPLLSKVSNGVWRNPLCQPLHPLITVPNKGLLILPIKISFWSLKLQSWIPFLSIFLYSSDLHCTASFPYYLSEHKEKLSDFNHLTINV